MEDINRLLASVTPETLKAPIWLRRNNFREVLIDLVKGDIANRSFFIRSQVKMLIQAFLFTSGWITLVLILGEFAKFLLTGFQIFEFPVSPSSFSRTNVASFLVASSAIYWNFSKKYGDQWTYCAGVFNRIFYDKFPAENPAEHLFRKTTFAIDLIDCNLWHHKSFFMDFNYILECAVKFDSSESSLCAEKLDRFKAGEMRLVDARTLISQLQNNLERRLQWQSVIAFEKRNKMSVQSEPGPTASSNLSDVKGAR
ncbi:MAG: hypothetical protein U1E10_07545 [Bdellovibrionales bacterium]|nr:hypothetical protein [Bdellovibrionales bacterium]